jgi:hypothetical protein
MPHLLRGRADGLGVEVDSANLKEAIHGGRLSGAPPEAERMLS